MRLTDEELSRVLWAHDCGLLCSGGHVWTNYINHPAYSSWGSRGCLFQFAKNIARGMDVFCVAARRDVTWFDMNYDLSWSVDELAELERQGIA